MGKLDGIVAIITGGGRGLGRAIAEVFAKEGSLIVVTAARERQEIEAVASSCRPGQALALIADVTDPRACEHVVAETVARFGRLDVLVNNAGRGMKYISPRFFTVPARFWEADPAAWKLVIDTNVNGPFYMARAAVPHMLRQGCGTIINVSINYETIKRTGFSPYGPSKAALEAETIIWAQDLQGTGITVNEILPGGATDTGMIPDDLSEELRSRLLKPEIITPLAVFLASEDGRRLTGRRLVATEWSPQNPDGLPASFGIGK